MTDFRSDPDRLLSSLVGPAGPELTCEECFELLDVYVEHELGAGDADDQAPGMHAHLQGCPACNEEHESLRALLLADEPAGRRL